MTEKWTTINGYDGLYEVSSFGRVRSLDQKVRYTHAVTGEEHFRNKRGRILRQTENPSGYWYVTLHKDKIVKTFSIHRLVALNMIPNPENYNQINHIDAIKSNNSVENLEWCSEKQNSAHAVKNNLIRRGENHYRSVLSDKDVKDIRASSDSIKDLCNRYGVEYRCMWQIVRGITRLPSDLPFDG